MKKRILAMASVLILMLTIPAYAVQSRAPAVLPSLSFSGTKATCEVLVTADNYIIEASNPVPTPLLGHRCRSSQEITGSPTPFSTSNHYLWICPRASFSLSNPNIAA